MRGLESAGRAWRPPRPWPPWPLGTRDAVAGRPAVWRHSNNQPATTVCVCVACATMNAHTHNKLRCMSLHDELETTWNRHTVDTVFSRARCKKMLPSSSSLPSILYAVLEDFSTLASPVFEAAALPTTSADARRTPHLGRLAQRGVTFQRVYSHTICNPSGRHSSQAGGHRPHASSATMMATFPICRPLSILFEAQTRRPPSCAVEKYFTSRATSSLAALPLAPRSCVQNPRRLPHQTRICVT